MTPLLKLVIAMTVLTWLSIMVASLLRSHGWTPRGMKLAMGNRDDLPKPTPLAGRADRASKNTVENFILFAAIALVAAIAAPNSAQVLLGAQIFFWARVVYLPIYYAGVQGIRTAVWAVSVAGLAVMVAALLM
ncbi:MAG: MAPEG family protein [Rhizobacter sp.]